VEERQRLIYALERAAGIYNDNRGHVMALKHVVHNLFAAMADVGAWNRAHPDHLIPEMVDGKVPAGDSTEAKKA
jgi:hypothetical protein